MGDFRRHRASRDVQVIFVEVPVGGSNKEARRLPPPAYPHQQREAWRPQRDVPAKPSKGEALRRWLDAMRRNDEAARQVMRP